VGSLLALVAFVLTLFGTLAVVAVASDPATGERSAYAKARDALPRTLGAVLLVGLALGLLFLPGIALMLAGGFDPRAAQLGTPQTDVAAGPLLGAMLVFLLWSVAALWAMARLILIYPVCVNERRGVGAIARSVALTRGLTLRMLGVLILYGLVLSVAWFATAAVVGTVFRLVLGPEGQGGATLLAAVAVAAVTAAFSVLPAVFTARLYAAVRDAREGAPPSTWQ